VGVHALHPRTYSVIVEKILAQEADSIQEDAWGINLKISYQNQVVLFFVELLRWSFAGLLRWPFAGLLRLSFTGLLRW